MYMKMDMAKIVWELILPQTPLLCHFSLYWPRMFPFFNYTYNCPSSLCPPTQIFLFFYLLLLIFLFSLFFFHSFFPSYLPLSILQFPPHFFSQVTVSLIYSSLLIFLFFLLFFFLLFFPFFLPTSILQFPPHFFSLVFSLPYYLMFLLPLPFLVFLFFAPSSTAIWCHHNKLIKEEMLLQSKKVKKKN